MYNLGQPVNAPRWGRMMGGRMGPRARIGTCPYNGAIPEYVSNIMEPEEPALNTQSLQGMSFTSPATWALLGIGGLVIYGGSLAGLTYAHRKKGRSWYCSVMPSAFWASLITGAAEAVALGAIAATSVPQY